MALKFYTSVAKSLKLKVIGFLEANFYVCRSYHGKNGEGLGSGGLFAPTLSRVNVICCVLSSHVL